ncbi:MAG: MFS transporter [Burkholderiaceae bacterium]|nr:MFS transporter [Burkholderiaceae bacterium]
MLALGFSSGLPFLLVLSTLGLRLREAGIDIAAIGHMSWVGLVYAFKWVWAPLVDALPLPPMTTLLGRRRTWLLLGQALVVIGLLGLGTLDPRTGLQPLVVCALLTAFGSATQDIAMDAFRIESASAERQPALAAAYQTGYRIAMLCAGAGALSTAAWAADIGPHVSGYHNGAWRAAYWTMAALMAVGAITVLFSPEPRSPVPPRSGARRSFAAWIKGALSGPFARFILGYALLVAGLMCLPPAAQFIRAHAWVVALAPTLALVLTRKPFTEFLRRYRWHAALILALIALYRISDVVMGIMAGPFYVDMGFTKREIAAVSGIFGVVMTLAGTFVGGALSMRLGVMRVLMGGALASAATNLLYAALALRGHSLSAFIVIVCVDNLASGIASAAFVGYLSSLTDVRYSATQYALLSSIMLLLPKFIAGFSGDFVKAFDYPAFFVGTALLGVPVLVLVALAARVRRADPPV